MSFKVFLFLCSVFTVALCQNWCTMQGCAANSHVACNNNGQFAPNCVNARELTLSSAQRNLVLNTFNSNRNQIAFGGFGVFLPARRMARVVWNDQLAWLASLNVRQCRMQHDACRNTPQFRWAGQNLGIMSTTGTHSTENVITGVIGRWYSQHQHTLMSDINRFTSTAPRGQTIGHFTAMITDRTTEIGCAISTYVTESGGTRWNNFLMACNFASTNMLNCPVYRSGSRAQECSLGADTQFPGLCRVNEPIDPNQLIC